MSENTSDFLAEIYRGAQMGAQTINTIVPKVEDVQIKNELLREQSAYQGFSSKALNEISKRNQIPQPINIMQEVGAWMGIQMNTLMSSSPSHIADLMIQGNNMGIIGITKSKNSHKDADTQTTSLADEFVKIQEDNIEKLKPFL